MTMLPSENNAGVITYLNNTFEPCICIKKNDRWQWEKIKNLSSHNFKKYREFFNTNLRIILDQNRTKINIKYEPHPDEYKFMLELFNDLDKNKRTALLQKYKNTKIGKSICITCLKYSNNSKKKCIHFDCPGQCESCFTQMRETCAACNKKQELECPICTETFHKKHLAQFETCKHVTCWKCYCRSYLVKKPLEKCPLCRKSIKIN